MRSALYRRPRCFALSSRHSLIHRGTEDEEREVAGGSYDVGLGAGFYVDASQPPWARNYRMASYVERELPGLISSELPADVARQSIMGHSMGGHGALTIALRNQGRYASVSAFSPICSSMSCPWGQKALSGYLGNNKESWRRYDTCALIDDGARLPELLV